jgi:hypothetical protein
MLTGLSVNSIILPLQLTVVDYNVVIRLHVYSLAGVNKFEDTAVIAEIVQSPITIDGAIGWHAVNSGFVFVRVRIRILKGASLNDG